MSNINVGAYIVKNCIIHQHKFESNVAVNCHFSYFKSFTKLTSYLFEGSGESGKSTIFKQVKHLFSLVYEGDLCLNWFIMSHKFRILTNAYV